jgi:hypothetical protein
VLGDLGCWHPWGDVWLAPVGTLRDVALWRGSASWATILVVVGVLFFQMEVQLVLMDVCLVATIVGADVRALSWGSWRCCWDLCWLRWLMLISNYYVVRCRCTWILQANSLYFSNYKILSQAEK